MDATMLPYLACWQSRDALFECDCGGGREQPGPLQWRRWVWVREQLGRVQSFSQDRRSSAQLPTPISSSHPSQTCSHISSLTERHQRHPCSVSVVPQLPSFAPLFSLDDSPVHTSFCARPAPAANSFLSARILRLKSGKGDRDVLLRTTAAVRMATDSNDFRACQRHHACRRHWRLRLHGRARQESRYPGAI